MGIARQNGTCFICAQPIVAGEHEISYARRGDKAGLEYHVGCKTETIAPAPVATDGLAAILATSLQPYLTLQREEITEELEARIEDVCTRLYAELDRPAKTVYLQSGKTIGTSSGQHEHFELLMELIALREPIYLWGEAGSGKSSAAYEASKILNLPFYYLGLQAQVPESRLMGHVSPTTGNYIESEFYKAYTRGGIFLLDELELGNGNLLGSLNGALANGKASFPCGTTDRHPDFICIATGNTPALGASVAYSDRRALDGSVRDRYIFVEWNTDATLEHKLAARHFEQSDKWVNWIQAVRVSAKRVSPKLVITQRASIVGSKLLATGKDVSKVAEMMVWRGFDRPAVNSLLASHPLPIF